MITAYTFILDGSIATPIPGAFSMGNAKMSDLVKKFLEHFKNPDSMNMPLPLPDPLPMPDRVYPLLARVLTTNVSAFGVSRLKIENFTSDIVEMKVSSSFLCCNRIQFRTIFCNFVL